MWLSREYSKNICVQRKEGRRPSTVSAKQGGGGVGGGVGVGEGRIVPESYVAVSYCPRTVCIDHCLYHTRYATN